MQAVTGVFASQAKADDAIETLLSNGVPADKITLLTPGNRVRKADPIPIDAGEQPGIGKAIGAVVGAAGGITGGSVLAAASYPASGQLPQLDCWAQLFSVPPALAWERPPEARWKIP